MAIMDIQVSPRIPGTVSVGDAVAEAQRVIKASGLTHVLTPMGTCIEGDPEKLYEVAAKIHAAMVKLGYERIGVYIKIDDRRDKPHSMASKLASVQAKLHRDESGA